jgi:hypothetical protein
MYRYPINGMDYFSTLISVTPDDHSMGLSLKRYIEIKIHHLFDGQDFDKVIVRNCFDRSSGISNKEKTDKLFNYMRPTAVVEDSILYINCFPGIDYIFHYGNIIKSYAAITERVMDVFHYLPTDEECWNAIVESGLKNIPKVHTVIMGYVEGLQWISDETRWHESGNFSWKRVHLSTKEGILLGCKHTYWGEIAGRIVSYLALSGVKRIIYAGKLGTLNPHLVPNVTIATGNTSILPNGESVSWNNLFEGLLDTDNQVYNGVHITVPSVLQETKEWLKTYKNNVDFVDPEIGHMAFAANSENIQFSYLHIISDNLSVKFKTDLSNERESGVIENRRGLCRKIGIAIKGL